MMVWPLRVELGAFGVVAVAHWGARQMLNTGANMIIMVHQC